MNIQQPPRAGINLDRMLYLVVSDHKDGPVIWEVSLSDMDLATVAKDIKSGQYRDVLAVLEINPVERICREVTRDFQSLIDRNPD
jgi:hypothetical protein